MPEVRVGLSISLTGRLRQQGEQAWNALQLWAGYVNARGGLPVGPGTRGLPVRLIGYDDGSRRDRAQTNVRRLLDEDRVDVLLGPYSSGLTMAVAPIAAAAGTLLWNHGGASDAIHEQGWRHVISVLAPASTYFQALPGLLVAPGPLSLVKAPATCRISIAHAAGGTFAGKVVAGLVEA
ncbi:MAG: ABC transporter substrate-binding protein, partial [Deltaproteobacteria bacterium]|nr:ABC transporter substrate-binding protein [Deltaproteobacteria bacterium]